MISALQSSMKATVKAIVDGVVDGLNTRVTDLENENYALREENVELKKRVSNLENQREADQQYSYRNFVRISGVAEKEKEVPDDVVMQICDALKTGIKLDDIGRCHRVGKPKSSGPRDILVKFTSYRNRQKLYKMRTGLKEASLGYRGTFVNEHLTRKRAELLYATRELVKSGKLIGAWSTDGQILAKRLAEGADPEDKDAPTELIRINSDADLSPFRK